jgi:hypothetical protein
LWSAISNNKRMCMRANERFELEPTGTPERDRNTRTFGTLHCRVLLLIGFVPLIVGEVVLVKGFVLLFRGAIVVFVGVVPVVLVVLVLLLFGLGPVSVGFVVLVVVPLLVIGIVSTATTVKDSDTTRPHPMRPTPAQRFAGAPGMADCAAERVRRDRE